MTSDQKDSLNELWLGGGVGADFNLGKFYIRPEVLVAFKLLSKNDNNNIDTVKAAGATNVSFTYLTVNLSLLAGYHL